MDERRLELSLLAYLRERPGSTWRLIQQGLGIAPWQHATAGWAYLAKDRLVAEGLLAADQLVDGYVVYRLTFDGARRLRELQGTVEVPDVEAREVAAL